MQFSPLFEALVEALRVMPGVGRKSAQRIAFALIEKQPKRAKHLAEVIVRAVDEIGQCQVCRTLTELPVCGICANDNRDRSTLCIVETPVDMMAIEQTAGYRGQYFVLLGRLSPLDGVGPEELRLNELHQRLAQDDLREVILATNATIEGEATANYLVEMMKPYSLKVSRIAYGVPVGSELEYIDTHTLNHAFSTRQQLSLSMVDA